MSVDRPDVQNAFLDLGREGHDWQLAPGLSDRLQE